jgi:glycosyltransferase involved in cell wall biosynthesis
MARISVIIPCFNRGHLLPRAIESVLGQSIGDFELIIVDDASSDDTQQLIRSFEDPRIEYIRHETNRGASAARNTGIEHSKGEFVAFLDSDDAWLESKLEKQLVAFDAGSTRLGVVYTTFRKIEWHYEPRVKRWQGDISARILVNNCVGTASTPMIRRACFETSGVFDENLRGSEDWDLWIRLAEHWDFECIAEDLVHYYPQPISMTSDRRGALRAYKTLFEKHAQRIASLDDAIRADHFFYRGRIYLTHRRLIAGFASIARALRIDPSHLGAVAHYLFVESGRKLLYRVQHGMRAGGEA